MEEMLLEIDGATVAGELVIQPNKGKWEMTKMAESVRYMKDVTRGIEVDLARQIWEN